jgi:hypothetical protein
MGGLLTCCELVPIDEAAHSPAFAFVVFPFAVFAFSLVVFSFAFSFWLLVFRTAGRCMHYHRAV